MTARPASSTRVRTPAARQRGTGRPPERPLAGAVARRRAREAGIERAVLGGALLLALTVTGFAGYVIAGQSRPYMVQAVLPAGTRPFAWKRAPDAPSRPPIPDLDPTTTGAIPEQPAPALPASAEPAAEAGYSLRRVEGGVAALQGPGGLVEVSAGQDLPGAGRVLAIRNTGAGWVVITTRTIVGPARL
jgi:hypothetical protein